MPVTLDDALALQLFRQLLRLPPVSGHIIIDMLTTQAAAITEQGKLIQQLLDKVGSMSSTDQQFQAELASFGEDLKKQTTVANGLKVAFAGVAQKLADQIALAQDKGASADELAGLKALHQGLLSNTDTITSAITDGTAAASEPAAPIVPPTTVDVPADGSAEGAADGTAESA